MFILRIFRLKLTQFYDFFTQLFQERSRIGLLTWGFVHFRKFLVRYQ